MLSPPEQAFVNLEQARALRASGRTYREIRRQLGLSPGQLGHIRRALKREKASKTRLRSAKANATERDLPIGQCVLPSGLRKTLKASGFQTLGDVADRLADPDFAGLETMAGIGPHRARLIKAVLDHFDLLPGPSDLQAEIERIFPELREMP
jgi:hypothetical protein